MTVSLTQPAGFRDVLPPLRHCLFAFCAAAACAGCVRTTEVSTGSAATQEAAPVPEKPAAVPGEAPAISAPTREESRPPAPQAAAEPSSRPESGRRVEEKPGTAEEGEEPVLAPAPRAGNKSPPEVKVDEALQLRKQRKYDEALARLKEAAALSPPPNIEAEVLFRTGETLFQKGRAAAEEKLGDTEPEPFFVEALRLFDDVVTRHPREAITANAVYLTGSSHLMLGDLAKARSAYERAYKDYPGYKDRGLALIRVGVCQAGLDDPIEASRTFSKYLGEFIDEGSKNDRVKVGKYLREIGMVGRPAPQLQVSRWLNGTVGPEGLKTFDGEPVVLVFFATWCGNCSAELPHLKSLMKTWGPRGVTFLGVGDPDDPKNTEPIEIYVTRHDVQFTDVALDPGSRSQIGYRVAGMPAAAVIDRRGTVRWRGHLAFFPTPLIEKVLEEK